MHSNKCSLGEQKRLIFPCCSFVKINQICLLLHQDAFEFWVTIVFLSWEPVLWYFLQCLDYSGLTWTFFSGNWRVSLQNKHMSMCALPDLNQCLLFCLFPPRITRAYRVHSDFHARYQAMSRTYVYRFALGLRHHTEMPVTERDLCWALRDTWVPPPLFCTCSEGFCLKPHHYACVTEAKSSQRGIGTSIGKSSTWIIHTHKQDPSQGQANDYLGQHWN